MALSEKVALITGASSGIGRAMAKALAAEGAQVSLAARSTAELETLAADIEAGGGEALALTTDVRNREEVEAMVTQTVETLGGLDIMVNNAGVGHWEREGIIAGDLDEWQTEIEVNLLGLMYGTKFAAAVMVEDGSGDIVNIGSGSGRHPFPDWPSYVASKYGVRGFTESALRDLRDEGIRVTHILPGEVETRMQPEEDVESRQMLDPKDVADAIV